MKDFEVIDAHAHLARSPDEEINYWVSRFPGRRERDRYGTPERALEHMDLLGISKMAVLTLIPRQYRGPLARKPSTAALPESQRLEEERRISTEVAPVMREFNRWGCDVGRRFPRLAPFCCLSKDLGDSQAVVDELLLRVGQGVKGVKLHPGIFSLFPDDEALWPMYVKCQELGLPVVADSAPYPVSKGLPSGTYEKPIDYGEPNNFEPVLKAFPRLTLVLAHLGSAWWDERVELAQKYGNVFFDTSQGFAVEGRIPIHAHRELAEEDAVRVIRKIGVERIMFGTDMAGQEPQPQLEQILRLDLTDEEKRMILSANAKRILHL